MGGEGKGEIRTSDLCLMRHGLQLIMLHIRVIFILSLSSHTSLTVHRSKPSFPYLHELSI